MTDSASHSSLSESLTCFIGLDRILLFARPTQSNGTSPANVTTELFRPAARFHRPPALVRQAERDNVLTGVDGDVLLAVEDIRHRRCLKCRVGLKLPQQFPVRGVYRAEHSAVAADEHDARAESNRAAPGAGIAGFVH